jgi:hypothetical protein
MRLLITLIIVTAAVVGSGCRSHRKPPPAAPVEERVEAVSPQNADALRAAFRQQYPGSQLGVVVAAINHPNGHFVSVGGLQIDQVAVGQVVTFIDSKQRPLATGVIVNVLPDQVHARIDEPTLKRRPQVGDMMVRL